MNLEADGGLREFVSLRCLLVHDMITAVEPFFLHVCLKNGGCVSACGWRLRVVSVNGIASAFVRFSCCGCLCVYVLFSRGQIFTHVFFFFSFLGPIWNFCCLGFYLGAVCKLNYSACFFCGEGGGGLTLASTYVWYIDRWHSLLF